MKEVVRRVDVIMYMMSVSLSSYRYAKGEHPFDFEETATAEFMTARVMPFLLEENCDYEKAHQDFVKSLFEHGWKYSPVEDLAKRLHPDLCFWNELSTDAQNMYGFIAALVCSATEFYASLKADLEEQFMDNLQSLIIKRKLIIPGSIDPQQSSH